MASKTQNKICLLCLRFFSSKKNKIDRQGVAVHTQLWFCVTTAVPCKVLDLDPQQ